MNTYIPPEYRKEDRFNCPHCSLPVPQTFMTIKSLREQKWAIVGSKCSSCHDFALWRVPFIEGSGSLDHVNAIFIYPDHGVSLPPPNKYMDGKIRDLYEEARIVYPKSVIAAGALIRKVIELMFERINIKTKYLGKKIKTLSKRKHVDENLIIALRQVAYYIGKGLHPSEINLDEKPEIVEHAFKTSGIFAIYCSWLKDTADMEENMPSNVKRKNGRE